MAKKAPVKEPVKASVSVADVVVDLGNSLLKAMKLGTPQSAVVVPHILRRGRESQFDKVSIRNRNSLAGVSLDTSSFYYRDTFFTVGDEAEINQETRRAGAPKYEADYYPALLIRLLLKLYPLGHENIRLMAAFPPGDIEYVDILMNSLGGKHVVTLTNGQEVVYKIREVIVYDEPIGGLRNYLLSWNGTHFRKDVAGETALCVDIGGKISNLVPFRKDGWVDYNNAVSLDMGIQDVMDTVSDVLVSQYKGKLYVRGSRLPHDKTLRDCLVTGVYWHGGDELDALDAIATATTEFRRGLREQLERTFDRGAKGFRYIVVTGGGGALLYDQLVRDVLDFNPNLVYLAHDNREEMHLANVFGGSKTLAALLAQRAEQR